MSIDAETLAIYGAKAREYADLIADLDGDKHLATFIAAMPPGARVLDLGCGPGRAAGQLAERAFVVDAVDAVPEMVDMAAAHPGVTAWQASFDDIGGVRIYDGIWANFSLLHAPRAALPGHLSTLKTALKPGGLLHIGMKTGTGAARDALGRLYTYYSEDDLRGHLQDADLSPAYSWTGSGKGLSGEMSDWVVIHAHG